MRWQVANGVGGGTDRKSGRPCARYWLFLKASPACRLAVDRAPALREDITNAPAYGLPSKTRHKQDTKSPALQGHLAKLLLELVALMGIEPMTSWMPFTFLCLLRWVARQHSGRIGARDARRFGCPAAGLPGHFSPHSLRHTYASLLLADGVSPAYV